MPVGAIDLLDEDLPLTEDLLGGVRADILLADGTPYVVEANIDSALGGAHDSDGVARRFLAAYAGDPVLEALGLTAPPSAVDARYEAVRTALSLTGQDRLAMVFTTGGTLSGVAGRARDDQAARAVQLSAVASSGLDMRVYPVEWLTLDDAGRLCVDDGPIDAVLRMFVPQGTKPSAGLEALAHGGPDGRGPDVHADGQLAAGQQGDPRLALGRPRHLSSEDADVVRRHVPRTQVLSADLRARRPWRTRHELVLKPSGSYGGVGVVVGPEVSAAYWAAALDAALCRRRLHPAVARRRRPPHHAVRRHGHRRDPREPQSPSASRRTSSASTPAGAYLRFAVPGAGPVVNVGQGALTSGLLLVP